MTSPAPPTLLRNLRIYTGETIIENGYILIHSGKIHSIGPVSSLPNATVTSLLSTTHVTTYDFPPGANYTLFPGLIDTHIHADKANPLALTQSLAFGVTTVCDMQNEIPHVLAMKTLSRSSPTTASDYKTAGLAATIENGWPIPVITAHDDSEETKREIATWPKLTDRESVVRYLDWLERETGQGGVDYVKLMHESGAAMGKSFSKPSVSLQKIIVEEAKKRGYLTVAHTLSLQDTLEVLDAGVNGLTHTFFDQPPSEELVDRYVGAGAWVCPTLATIGSLTEEGREMQERYAGDERVKGLLDAREKGKMCRCLGMGGAGAMVEYAYESVRRLRERGVHVVCGSDAAGPALGTSYGLTLHQELSLFVTKCGMSPQEALASATSLPAKLFRFHDRGRLAEGLRADMLLVRGNPLERVEESLGVVGVWREGWRARVWEGALERELEGLDAGGGSAQEEGKVGVVVVAEREGEVDLHEFD